jgi:ATP adenylyltransferase
MNQQGRTGKILWAPWRMAYIKEDKRRGDGCIFCNALNDNRDEENLILHRGEHTFVIMNRYPYTHGHLMILPLRHVGDIEHLSRDETLALMEDLKTSIRVIRECLSSEGFNIGINLGKVAGAGHEDHLHIHVVPRWNGDHNFMPVVASTKIISEHLRDTYGRLKAGFDKLNSVNLCPQK